MQKPAAAAGFVFQSDFSDGGGRKQSVLLLVLPTLESAQYQQAFGPQQVPMLANIALLSFGGTCLVNGYLIFKSGYFPKAFGILMQAAGECYLVACQAALSAPALVSSTPPAALLPCLVGELS